MKKTCYILDDYQSVALDYGPWASLRDQVEVHSIPQHLDDDQLIEKIKDAQIVVVMRERTPISSPLLKRLPKLELIVTSGMRNASIDMTAAKEHGITVCGTASGSEPPVELTWALILALAKKVVPENTAFKNDGPWQSNVTADLYGKNLGVIGLGKIGSKVAKVGLAFGMNVSAWSPNLMAETAQTIGIKFASSKENLLKDSDYVTIHLVLGERSRNLIAAEDLAAMKKSAFIVNTSRAAIINQQDLINALKNHRISGAAQDVFDTEPLPLGHELRRLPNFLGTPHLGYVSSANYKKYFGEAVENINAFLSGKAVKKLN